MGSILDKYTQEKANQRQFDKYIELKLPLTPEETLRKRTKLRELNAQGDIVLQSRDSLYGVRQVKKYTDSLYIPSIAPQPGMSPIPEVVSIDPSENNYVENNYIDDYFN